MEQVYHGGGWLAIGWRTVRYGQIRTKTVRYGHEFRVIFCFSRRLADDLDEQGAVHACSPYPTVSEGMMFVQLQSGKASILTGSTVRFSSIVKLVWGTKILTNCEKPLLTAIASLPAGMVRTFALLVVSFLMGSTTLLFSRSRCIRLISDKGLVVAS